MTSTTDDPAVLTGCGWVTPFAAGSIADILSAAAARARSAGDGRAAELRCWQVPDNPPFADLSALSKEIKRDKGAWMAAVALEQACRGASLELGSLEADRVGLTVGCGLAGQLAMIEFAGEVREQSARFVSPIHFPQTVGNYIAGALARGYHIRGPSMTLACGAASAMEALIEACAIVMRGGADVVLAGGTEQLSAELAQGLGETCGVLSEGACFFVVERASRAAVRKVKPLAKVMQWCHRVEETEYSKSSGEIAQAEACGSGGGALAAQAEACGTGVVSVAGCRCPGAVFVEHWIGSCIGASGAAAVAAAIGAVEGRAVPLIDAADQKSVNIGTVGVDDLRASDGAVPVKVIAQSGPPSRTGHTTLSLLIPG